MSCEALWSLQFIGAGVNEIPSNTYRGGGGIVVLETGRVLGGDASFSYIGDYEISNGVMTVTVRVKRFNNILPALYKDDYKLTLKGTFNEKGFQIIGSPEDNPNYKVGVELTRIAELP